MQSPVRILFVDDEQNILRALQRFFLEDEYEILTATSGTEALDLLTAENRIQVVVSDYRMPQMDGVDFLRRVRERWPQTVRVVLSGFADTAAMVSAINEGQIYRFIPKPWDETELRMTVAAAVEQYRRQKKEIMYADALQKRIDELERENSFLVNKAARADPSDQSHEIIDSLPVGVLVMDDTGRIVRLNPEAESLLGAGRESAPSDEPGREAPVELVALMKEAPAPDCPATPIRIDGRIVMATVRPMKPRRDDLLAVAVLWREGPNA